MTIWSRQWSSEYLLGKDRHGLRIMTGPVKVFFALVLMIPVWSGASSSEEGQSKRYPDVKTFLGDQSCGLSKENRLDINSDGKKDILVFTSCEGETNLHLLIRQKTDFIAVFVPVDNDVEIIGSPGHFELKVSEGTFPMYGDIHGPNKYYWYDFYQVAGASLKLVNGRHPDVYKGMLPLYNERIHELEEEIRMGKQELGTQDESVQEVLNQLRRDQIGRYKQFIRKASEILGSTR